MRHGVWNRYAAELAEWAAGAGATLMHVPDDREHPAHLFYLLMPNGASRDALLAHLRGRGCYRYFPLHPARQFSPAGLAYGRTPQPCDSAHDFSSRLVRLPLWAGLDEESVDRVIAAVSSFRSA